MNCTALDQLASHLTGAVETNDVAFWVLTTAISVVSLVLLLDGARLMRPLGALVGGVAGSVGVFVLLSGTSCEVRLAMSGIAGVLLALLALFLLKAGLFLVGAASLGGLSHLVYEALPLPRSEWYYVVVGAGGLLGAVVSWCQRRQFAQIASSLLASGGIATVLVLATERAGSRVPDAVLLAQVTCCTFLGTFVQHTIRRRRIRVHDRRCDRMGPSRPVPVGIPVE